MNITFGSGKRSTPRLPVAPLRIHRRDPYGRRDPLYLPNSVHCSYEPCTDAPVRSHRCCPIVIGCYLILSIVGFNFSLLVMSPMFLSSLRRPPTPGTFVGSGDGVVDLIRTYGSFTSYSSTESGDRSDESDDSMSMPRLETPSPLGPVYESDEYKAPPSTQPRPVDRDLFQSPPSAEDARRREWSMDQFVCFVYRESAVRWSLHFSHMARAHVV